MFHSFRTLLPRALRPPHDLPDLAFDTWLFIRSKEMIELQFRGIVQAGHVCIERIKADLQHRPWATMTVEHLSPEDVVSCSSIARPPVVKRLRVLIAHEGVERGRFTPAPSMDGPEPAAMAFEGSCVLAYEFPLTVNGSPRAQ